MSGILTEVYPQMFRHAGKRMLYQLHLLFSGEVEKGDAAHHLPMRLSREQRDEAQEAFQVLSAIVAKARLERTEIGRARRDPAFAKFKEQVLKPLPVTARKTAAKRKAVR